MSLEANRAEEVVDKICIHVNVIDCKSGTPVDNTAIRDKGIYRVIEHLHNNSLLFYLKKLVSIIGVYTVSPEISKP